MKKIMITGAAGFLGCNLLRHKPAGVNLLAAGHNNSLDEFDGEFIKFDITDAADTYKNLKKSGVDTIIHAAALADPGQCFNNQELAKDINIDGTINIARACSDFGIKLIFISTDLVYKGDKQNHNEQQAGDCCFYGQTKLQAERAIADICPDAFIARIALLFGQGHSQRRCFAEQVIASIRNGHEVKLFTDEYRCPLLVDNLCQILYEVAGKDINGIYNIGGPERISRYDFIKAVCEEMDLDTQLLIPTKISDINFAEPRPADCSMDSSKAKAVLETEFMPLAVAIKKFVAYQ